MYPNKIAAGLLGSLGGLGLILASVGLYGVLAYAVTQRVREIGIRIALGASRAQVLRVVLRDVAALVAISIVIGLALGVVAVRPLQSFLSAGVSLLDPFTIATVVLVLITTGILAAVMPARRALRVDPIEALRYE